MRRLVGSTSRRMPERHTMCRRASTWRRSIARWPRRRRTLRAASRAPRSASCATWSERSRASAAPAPDRERRTPAPGQGHGHARGGVGREPLARRGQPARHRRGRRPALPRRARAARPHRGHRARGRARRSPGCCSPAIGPTTWQPDGSPPRGSGCPGSAPRAGSTRARASRRSSASRCSRRWRRDSSSSHPTAADRRRTSRRASPGCSPPRGIAARLREALESALDVAAGDDDARADRVARDGARTASRSSAWRRPSARCTAASRATRPHSSSRSTRPDDPPRHQPGLRLAPAAARDPRDGVAGPRGTRGRRRRARDGGHRRRSSASSAWTSGSAAARTRRHHDASSSPSTRPTRCADSSTRPARRRADTGTRRRSGYRPHVATGRGRARDQRSSTTCRPTRSSSTTSRSARASASPPPGSRTPTSSWDIRRRSRSVTRCTGTRHVAGRLPARCRRARGAPPTLPAGVGRLHRGMEPRRAGARPDALPSSDAFAEHGPLVLYNYPEELAARARPSCRRTGSWVDASRRADDPEVDAWLDAADPFVYVSFGSFLSVRGDVLRRVADALRTAGVRAAIATGSTDAAELGELPARLAGARLRAPGAVCSARPPPP